MPVNDDAPKQRHYCSACDCIHEDGKCLAPPDAQPECFCGAPKQTAGGHRWDQSKGCGSVPLNGETTWADAQPEAGEEIPAPTLADWMEHRGALVEDGRSNTRHRKHCFDAGYRLGYEHAVATLRRKP